MERISGFEMIQTDPDSAFFLLGTYVMCQQLYAWTVHGVVGHILILLLAYYYENITLIILAFSTKLQNY